MNELAADLAKLETGAAPTAVREMMARSAAGPASGGAAMPHPVPAQHHPAETRPRWPLFAGLGATGVVLVGVLALLLTRGVGKAGAHPRAGATGDVTATTAAAVPAAALLPAIRARPRRPRASWARCPIHRGRCDPRCS